MRKNVSYKNNWLNNNITFDEQRMKLLVAYGTN